MKMNIYVVEIHFKGGKVPLIQYNLDLNSALRLYGSAARRWTLRRIVDGEDGRIVKEEKRGNRERPS